MDDEIKAAVTLEQVHPHLVAEAAARQLRLTQWALDGAGFRGLAHEAGHLANLIEQAITPPWLVA